MTESQNEIERICRRSLTNEASQINEFIADLKENDYRKQGLFSAPYECFDKLDYRQNPLYLTTVACPLIAFRKMF